MHNTSVCAVACVGACLLLFCFVVLFMCFACACCFLSTVCVFVLLCSVSVRRALFFVLLFVFVAVVFVLSEY